MKKRKAGGPSKEHFTFDAKATNLRRAQIGLQNSFESETRHTGTTWHPAKTTSTMEGLGINSRGDITKVEMNISFFFSFFLKHLSGPDS